MAEGHWLSPRGPSPFPPTRRESRGGAISPLPSRNAPRGHGHDLGGQLIGDNFIFGRLVASNLTSGQGGRASRFSGHAFPCVTPAGIGAAISSGCVWLFLKSMPAKEFGGR